MDGCTVRQADTSDAVRAAVLFDAYRQFYGQPGDVRLAETFLQERLAAGESYLFIAEADGGFIGFAQLYPGFSSVRASPALVLNDLFVDAAARGRGVARALIAAVERFALEQGVSRLSLSTATDNHSAQALYRSLGWQLDTNFLTFTRDLEQ